jgi:hypothetical protein
MIYGKVNWKTRRSRKIERNIKEEKSPRLTEDDQGVLWYKGRICVPDTKELKDKILREAQNSAYSIHPGRRNKMYHDLKATYWWYEMKRDVAKYLTLWETCQRVKTEYQRPTRLLQPLHVPEWKWEEIAMDFVMGLSKTQSGYDSLWVIVD